MPDYIQLRCILFSGDLVLAQLSSVSPKAKTRRFLELANLGVLFENALGNQAITLDASSMLEDSEKTSAQIHDESEVELRVRVYSFERSMQELEKLENPHLRSRRFIELANRGALFERVLMNHSIDLKLNMSAATSEERETKDLLPVMNKTKSDEKQIVKTTQSSKSLMKRRNSIRRQLR